MEGPERIERALKRACSWFLATGTPPGLAEALRYALFPGGGRVRPRVCLAVSESLGDPFPTLADAAAVSIEMIHCASLVHDDLPCFDAADMRRGRPSLHRAFGEDKAVLVGDGLIVAAFGWLAKAGGAQADKSARVALALARGVGADGGIVAGQAWESETSVDMAVYHRAKTAALFGVAMEAGSLAAGGDGDAWRECGLVLGEAYQIADDISDFAGDSSVSGKPTGKDSQLDRPNAVNEFGLDKALSLFEKRLAEVRSCVPSCAGRERLVEFLVDMARRLCPADMGERLKHR